MEFLERLIKYKPQYSLSIGTCRIQINLLCRQASRAPYKNVYDGWPYKRASTRHKNYGKILVEDLYIETFVQVDTRSSVHSF